MSNKVWEPKDKRYAREIPVIIMFVVIMVVGFAILAGPRVIEIIQDLHGIGG